MAFSARRHFDGRRILKPFKAAAINPSAAEPDGSSSIATEDLLLRVQAEIVLLLAAFGTGPASAQSSPEAQARIVSLYGAVGGYCSAVARVDVAMTRVYVTSAIAIGRAKYGQARFDPIALRASKERDREVNAIGPRAWCRAQRAALERSGVRVFQD